MLIGYSIKFIKASDIESGITQSQFFMLLTGITFLIFNDLTQISKLGLFENILISNVMHAHYFENFRARQLQKW